MDRQEQWEAVHTQLCVCVFHNALASGLSLALAPTLSHLSLPLTSQFRELSDCRQRELWNFWNGMKAFKETWFSLEDCGREVLRQAHCIIWKCCLLFQWLRLFRIFTFWQWMFLNTTDMLKYYISLCNFVIKFQHCAFDMFRFVHKKHLVRLIMFLFTWFRRLQHGWKLARRLFKNIPVCYHTHSWKMSRHLSKNIPWFHAHKCWSVIPDSGLWLGSLLAWLSRHRHHRHLLTWKSACSCKRDMTHCRNVDIVEKTTF